MHICVFTACSPWIRLSVVEHEVMDAGNALSSLTLVWLRVVSYGTTSCRRCDLVFQIKCHGSQGKPESTISVMSSRLLRVLPIDRVGRWHTDTNTQNNLALLFVSN